MEWISIEERLPDEWVDVVTWCISKQTATFEEGDEYAALDRIVHMMGKTGFRTELFGYGVVTHWCKIPDPPKHVKSVCKKKEKNDN